MTTGNFSSNMIGWMAIATGTAGIFAVIFITLMFTVNPVFGILNDIFNAIVGISSAILAWMLYTEYHSKYTSISQIVLVLAIIGAIAVIIGSVLVIFKFTGWVLAGWYTGLGNAMIGLWLAVFCYSMQRGNFLPHNLAAVGLVVGLVMAMGLLCIPGILARIDSMDSLPWYLNVGYLGFFGTYILYPIWTIWLGRILLPE